MADIKWVEGKRKTTSTGGFFDFYATYQYPIQNANGDILIPCAIYAQNYYVGSKGKLPNSDTVYFGLAYKSENRVTTLSGLGLPVSNSMYTSKYTWYLQNNPNYQVYNGYTNESITWLFSNGVGFIDLSGTQQVGQYNRGSYLADYSTYFDVSNMSYAIPFLTFSDTDEFWRKLEVCAKLYVPWQDDISTTGGGKGNWDDDNTDPISVIDPETLNTNSIGRTFFASTYRLGFGALQGISSKLWSPSFLDWAKQFFVNPMEGIISLNLIPYEYAGESIQPVIIGSYDTGVAGSLIYNQFQKLDCGEIEIPEKWGGAIDYKSRVTLYLPFIGSHDLDSSEIIGSKVHIYYIIDLMTGSCVASVKVKKGDLDSVLYQFNGNCAYNLPISQNNYSTLLSSMLSASASVAVGVATGGASTPLMIGAGASVASDARPHVAHSGNLSANVGYMGIKKPYIILTRPQQALPEYFGAYKGYQSNITKKLSDCKGFTKVGEIHLDGISRATSAELAQIESLLKTGVIIS